MWLFDRNAEREEEAKHKRWMEQFATPDPDDGPEPPSLEVRREHVRYRCRFCGREENAARYCPQCLADTLVPIR